MTTYVPNPLCFGIYFAQHVCRMRRGSCTILLPCLLTFVHICVVVVWLYKDVQILAIDST